MLILSYIVLVFTVIQMLVALVNLLFETYLPGSDELEGALVSVLIPARNEENNISNVLDDLIHQQYRNIEVIVFNDQSDDRTAEIVTELTFLDNRISLVSSDGLPEGWLGKNYACHSLSQRARGKYLLFLDADVRISNNVIGRAISFAEKKKLDLISIFPSQEIISFGEKITVPNMNYILVSLLPLILVRKSKFPSLAAANGQFMFFTANTYNSMNPHKMVKSNKVEDISIARLYKSIGNKVACMLGDDSLSCRMYSGFNDAVRGFSKNVIAYFGNSFVLASLFWIITSSGFILILSKLPPAIIMVYIILYLSTRIIISKVSMQNIFYNLLYIIPLQFSLALFIYHSFINKNFRKFQWKGRSVN